MKLSFSSTPSAFLVSAVIHLVGLLGFTYALRPNPVLTAVRSYDVGLVSLGSRDLSENLSPPAPEQSRTKSKSSTRIEQRAGFAGEGGASHSGPVQATLRDAFIGELMIKIDRQKRYPVISKRSGEQGVAEIEFVLVKSGDLKGVRLVSSTGYPRLDDAAITLISDLGHFKPIPDALGIKEWKLVLPIAYVLNP